MKEKWKKLPIFKKAMELQKLVDHIVKVVENTEIQPEHEIEKEMIKHNLNYLRENSLIIPAKIAGVADEDMLYDIKMENAAIIHKAARELITDARDIQMHGFKDIEYLDLLRNEVDEFRILFSEWVKTFDCWNYSIDRWGLFNPPGINYDDKDPDDDRPFQNPFYDIE
ncbi:hypothetical protein [Winogradskyella immobilis]|uniref:Uncharacterized protein n=1 Tax=Winogradskyella immobilis TaxID=2816852 RepID=A0ABS8EMQ0_9FLAO|nr:hypothetical protein [Winogradskyella immobilis]MCC1484488.1 hypothetical protein [Winogradskyella immobilis]MCG0016580.1 hypothetical protein [Winogradskyella immobilis]